MQPVYTLGRDVVLSTENSSRPFVTVLRCRRLPHPVADVTSVPGEKVSEAYGSSCPFMG